LVPGHPPDRAAAEAWITDPANATVDPTQRAYVLTELKRREEALRLLDDTTPTGPLDVARRERLRLSLAAGGIADRTAFDRSLAELPPDDRKYQALSFAMYQLDRNLQTGQPWRAAFLREVRHLGPWRVAPRSRLFILGQQFGYSAVFLLVAFGLLVVELAT
jgi:hypothetical protein